MDPYLTGEERRLFDAWHQRLLERTERDLTFAEIRKGVQALSSLYVARRGRLPDGGAALEGAGKRAAFALYYAPLHFLATWHVVKEIGFEAVPVSRLWDLGCGTGASGAAWGTALAAAGATGDPSREEACRSSARAARDRPASVKIIGVDRSGFALEEAEGTYRAFGLRGGTQRIDLGHASSAGGDVVQIGRASGAADAPVRGGSRRRGYRLGDEHEIPRVGMGSDDGDTPVDPRSTRRGNRARPSGRTGSSRRRTSDSLREDDAVLLAYTLNEMTEPARETLLHEVAVGISTSRPLLVIEPIAKRAAPWWSRWERALGEEALVLHSFEWRKRIDLPAWIAEMDRAAGLDHAELTARVLGVVG